MDSLIAHLVAAEWLDLRDVLRLLLLSGFFTLAAIVAFPSNAPSRRALMLAAVTSLGLLPWLLSVTGSVWQVQVDAIPEVTLATMLPNFLLWLWVSVACFRVGSFGVGVVLELRQVQSAPQIVDSKAVDLCNQISQALDLPAPKLRQGQAACSTTLIGPTLLLPPAWKSWDIETLEAVLAHELVHIQRRDDRWMLFTHLLVMVYWWMPWINLLAQKYLQVMEESCDDAASAQIGQTTAYAQALAQAAGARISPTPTALAGMHAHHLVGRVGRFANARIIELDTTGVYWCVTAILVVVTLISSVEPIAKPVFPRIPDAVVTRPLPNEPVAALSYYPVVADNVRIIDAHRDTDLQRLREPAYAPPTIYPGTAIRQGVEGDVVVEFSVNKDGSVAQLEIITSEPAGVFETTALRAVQNTRYKPGYTSAMRVRAIRTEHVGPPTRVQKHFRFRMQRE